jgi:hypothetical protein
MDSERGKKWKGKQVKKISMKNGRKNCFYMDRIEEYKGQAIAVFFVLESLGRRFCRCHKRDPSQGSGSLESFLF